LRGLAERVLAEMPVALGAREAGTALTEGALAEMPCALGARARKVALTERALAMVLPAVKTAE
jgi:hypothetical protein